MNNINLNLNSNPSNPSNIQFTPQQLQMLRAAGMNANSNVNNVLAQSQGQIPNQNQLANNQQQQQAAQLYNMMFLQQQQQQQQQQTQQQQQQQQQQQSSGSMSNGPKFNSNTSPNLFPMSMNPASMSMNLQSLQQSPNMMNGMVQQLNPAASNQNIVNHQAKPNVNNPSASPQIMAQMMAAAGFNQQLQFLAQQQQQIMPQQILLNPQQLALQQQNQLLYSSIGTNASSNTSSPSMHPIGQPNQQQINQMIAARQQQLQQQFAMQQQAKMNFSPQNNSSSPSITAQQLFQNKQMQQQPVRGQGTPMMRNNMPTTNPMTKNNMNPMNTGSIQPQIAIPLNLGPIRPKIPIPQPGSIKPPPSSVHPSPQQHQETISRAPLFPICPQQSLKLFSLAPMHGLLDLHASIHGGYQVNGQGGTSSTGLGLGGTHVDGNSVSGVSGGLLSGVTPATSAQNIVKGLADLNGRRVRLEEPVGRAAIESGQKRKLDQVIEELDVECELDADSERCLLRFADDFLNQVVLNAAKIAKHAGSSTIQVKDVQLELEHNWNIRIPGFEGGIIETSTAPKKSLAAAQSAALSLTHSTPHNVRLQALAKVRKEALLRKGIAFMDKEREACELASAYELSNNNDNQEEEERDVEEEIVDVVEMEEGGEEEALNGEMGEEASDDLIDTPTNLTVVDSPFVEIID